MQIAASMYFNPVRTISYNPYDKVWKKNFTIQAVV